MRLSDSLYFLYIGSYFKDMFQHLLTIFGKCPRSVNNSRTNFFVCDLGGYLEILGVLNGPPPLPHTHPSPASMSKFPSVGFLKRKNMFLSAFL